MRRTLFTALLLPLAACQDVPLQPETPNTGPVNVSVAAAPTEFVKCGEQIPITVTVTDARGRALSGFHLNFNVLDGDGRMFGGAALTNNRGVARDIWTIGGGANLSNTLSVRAVDPGTGVGTTYFQQTVTTLSQIAFASRRGGTTSSIQVMNADGTGIRRLTDDADQDQHPTWSPDGRQIAFTSGRDGFFPSIQVMNADGTGLRRLTGPMDWDHEPTWSPDGRQIAFMSNWSNPKTIVVMNADGTGRRDLTDGAADAYHPAWSPDGRQIAFMSHRGGSMISIQVMNADGTGRRQLTDDAGLDMHPAWSPDGRQIAFASYRGGTRYSIQVMNADGTGVRHLTDDAGQEQHPTWSPDGRQIAFTSDRGNGTGTYSMWVMNADGTGLRRLSNDEGSYPSWSGCTP